MGSLVEKEAGKKGHSFGSSLARFFLHGIAFSVLLALSTIVWAFVAASLVIIGFTVGLMLGVLIGLILGFILFLFIAGGLNILLTEFVWKVSIRQNWKAILGHGLVLFVVLVLIGIPSIIINFLVPSWVTIIVVYIAYCFVDGFVAKKVAFVWKSDGTPYDSEWTTVLKYPALFGLLMADMIVTPIFVTSLATSLWWVALILFCLAQSPLAFLAYEQNKHANWTLQPRDGWWTPNEPQEMNEAAVAGRLSWKATLARLFLHGTAFSVLLMIAGIAWIVLTAFLIFVGFIIGFILGIIVLFFTIGGLNSFLTEHIWHVPIKRGWQSVLGQGLLLLAVLAIARIPLLVISLVIPSLVITAVFFIVYCFIDGLLARRIAFYWESKEYMDIFSAHD
ncbi:MAG: hypothetical protein ABR962_02045 [Candidatus Bathyarchaeia archaeon]